MTEIAVRPDNTPTHATPAPAVQQQPMSALVAWAYEAQQAEQIAQSLARTSFVPQSMRGKPHDVTAAILAGQELGLQPMASLRSMDIIQGTPALRAHAMRGLVQSHGHSVQLVESTDNRCIMRGRRAGETEWQTVEWTIDRASKLGLLGKDQWKKQPKSMLQARATGEICRLIASDVLYAMPYASEELDGGEGGPMPAAAVSERVTVAEITGEQMDSHTAPDEADVMAVGEPPRDFVEEIRQATTREQVRKLWEEAKSAGDPRTVERAAEIEAAARARAAELDKPAAPGPADEPVTGEVVGDENPPF